MNQVRILVGVLILAGFVWLNWWVVPPIGLFHMAMPDPSLPDNGYALIFFRDGKGIDATALSMLSTGWATIRHVWPFFIAGLFTGVMIGYTLGELARQEFSVDQASDEAIRLSEELLVESRERDFSAEIKLEKARDLKNKTRALQEKIYREQQEIWQMKETAETELEAAQGFRQRATSLEKELYKVRGHIRRLKKKQSSGKWVDAEPWSE